MIYDVIIIGSGPSALMCASNLKNKNTLILEKNNYLGGKIKVSGGGRCNVTNLKQLDDFLNYIPHNHKFLFSTLNNFNCYDIYEFFLKNGLELKEEDHNRIFPVSNKSQSVIDVFKKVLENNNVDYRLDYEVKSVSKNLDVFNVDEFRAYNVVIATGGITHNHLGTTGFGHEVARNFEIDVTKLNACETPLISNDQIIKDKLLQGVTLIDCKCKLVANKKVIKIVEQNILFTHFGLSGPAALHLSYYFLQNKDKDVKLILKPIDPVKRIIPFLDENGEIEITINDLKGFKTAFVTCGGVNTKQISPKNFESKKVSNLFFIGEVNDVNAFTGGYNISICFSQGYTCAKYINKID